MALVKGPTQPTHTHGQHGLARPGKPQLRMYPKCLFAFLLNASLLVRLLVAYECTPCDHRTCPVKAPHACENGRSVARDPCGCCDQCSRLEWELCGGQDWAMGYCALGLTCVSVNQTGLVNTFSPEAEVGVCKGWCAFRLKMHLIHFT